ncbi:MAG: hypothetical protein LBP85_00530 [Prevotellaceae bacterium]|jgi:hypothetical protein|nr:hypothetical protein [Prevotellaceae bacterium]
MLSELPEAVKNTVFAQYSGYRIEDIDKISIGIIHLYKIELENYNTEITVILKDNGVII